jgi:tetratricopeptide (TPR) repeat protein
VLLEGVLGIGKSRLMSEFRRYAAVHGAVCLFGRCLSYQVPVPYQPLVMALRESLAALRETIPQVWLAELARLLPEIAAENPDLSQLSPTGDAAERQRLFSAVTHLVDRVGQPQQTVIMFLDDLHWADKASLDLLQFLLYEGPARLLIIGAYRPEDTPAAHPLTQLRRSLSRERRVEIIPLQPLEQTSIESLVANLVQASDRVRLAKFLSPESQGNPFFLTELLYSLREIAAAGSSVWKLPPGWEQDIQPLTRSMQDVVLDRVERLSPVSLNALKAAAVIGHTFEAAMLAAVSERDTAEFLVDWQQRHLVKSVGSGYEFAHHKIQQVVYETIRLAQRQAWHLAAGQYLAGQDGSTNRTTQLAHHYYHSAEPVLALPYFLQAAREAIEVLAFEEVVFLCTLALTLSPLELVVHYQLLQLRHRAYQFIGDTESEGRDAMEMVGLAQNSGDPRQLADAVQRLGRYYYLRGELEEARQTFSEVVGVAKASGDVGTAVRILDTLAMLFRGSVTGQKEALRLQDEALAMARDAAASQMEAMLLADKSVILAEIGILGTAVELIQRAEKLLRAENVTGYLPHVLYIRGGVYSLIGQYELAQADFDEALTLCKALNIGTYLTVIYSNMGRLALAAGKFDMARRHYSEMLHLAEVDGRPLVVGKAQLGLGWAAYLEADFQSAFDYLSRSIALCEREDVQNRVLAEALLGLTLVGLNETKQAVKVIDNGIKLFEAGEKVLVEKPQIFWSYYWILQEAGRTAEADHWLRAGRELVAAQAESLPEQWREAFYKSLNGRFLTAT